MLKLYPDQQETIDLLRSAMSRNKHVLLQAPTGSGKTAMSTHIIENALKKNKRVLFCVPRKELMQQTHETFLKYGLEHGFVAAGKKTNNELPLHVGMVQTMARRLDEDIPDIDILIVDETHYGTGQLNDVIEFYKSTGAWVIGLSATPWKSSGQGLGCWYGDMVQGKDIAWLIENKRLSDYKPFAPSTPDLSSLSVVAGDYNNKQLAELMEQDNIIIGDAVKYYKQEAEGKLHIVFCSSVNHSKMVANTFRKSGIPTEHIDGTTPDKERREIIQRYARRETMVLTNCNLLCFGFDLSQASGMDVCIESMSDLKPTKSLALQMQKWGRVLRYKDEPAIILDHANNFKEHGLPCSEREWTLRDRLQKKKNSEPVPPTRQCPSCFYVHPPAPFCPDCGHVYEIKDVELKEVDGELQEIEKEKIKKERKMEQGQARTLDALIALGRSRGYKNPVFWAKKVHESRRNR